MPSDVPPSDPAVPESPEDAATLAVAALSDPGATFDPRGLGLSLDHTARSPVRPPTPAHREVPPSGGDEFELIEPIGRGGFGDVWLAEQVPLGRRIAVKRLRPELLQADGGTDSRLLEAMFLGEARIQARLEHPNIVPVYDLDFDAAGRALLGMQRVRGQPWQEWLDEDLARPLDELPVADFLDHHLPVLVAVAQAVAFAHSRGVVHRDLKPQQVMVGEFGEVLLMDWGLAMLVEPTGAQGLELDPEQQEGVSADPGPGPSLEGDRASTAASAGTARRTGGTLVPAGTPSYMAPEQTSSDASRLGPWTDLYLLGGCLYFLLTGTPPHRGARGIDAFVAARRGEIEPAEDRAPDRKPPAELCRLAESLLAADPDHRRPADARSVVEALQGYLTGASRRRRARGLVDRAARDGRSDYDSLTRRLSALREAERLWGEHPDIPQLRVRLLSTYADAALEKGDLRLAAVQAEQIEDATVRQPIEERVERAVGRRRSLRLQRRAALLASLLLLIAVVVVGAASTSELRRERDRARSARAEAEDLLTFLLGDVRDELEPIGRLAALEPMARRAEAYFERREPAPAGSEEERRRIEALDLLATTLAVGGDVRGAIEVRERAVTMSRRHDTAGGDASDLRVLQLLAMTQHRSDLGRPEDALATLDALDREIDQRLAVRPDDIDWRLHRLEGLDLRGIVLFDQGRFEESFATYERLLEDAERLPDEEIDPALMSFSLARFAVLAGETDRPEAALEATARALDLGLQAEPPLSPRDQAFLEAIRGSALIDAGRREEAGDWLARSLRRLRTAVSEDPDNAENRLGLGDQLRTAGDNLRDLGRSAEARAAWEEAVKVLEPARETTSNLHLLDVLSRSLLRLGRSDEARPLVERLLAEGWTHRGYRRDVADYGFSSPAAEDSPFAAP
ncbi:MAG: protein kinase [Acidobacteriota bacterium]